MFKSMLCASYQATAVSQPLASCQRPIIPNPPGPECLLGGLTNEFMFPLSTLCTTAFYYQHAATFSPLHRRPHFSLPPSDHFEMAFLSIYFSLLHSTVVFRTVLKEYAKMLTGIHWLIALLSIASCRLCSCDGNHDSDTARETRTTNSGECEWVTLPLCQMVTRSWSNFPNLLGHRNQMEIANSSEYRYLKNLSSRLYGDNETEGAINHQAELVQRCELQIYQVACSYLVPKCVYLDKILVTSLPPCQSVCTEVKDRCEGVLSSVGLRWPEFLNCESWVQCHLPSVCRHSDVILGSESRSGNANLPIRTSRRRKVPKVEFKHHSERMARKTMTRITRHCPEITRLYSVGRSGKGRPLYVMEISDNPGIHEPLEPEVKYIGAIHGNEVLGRELLLQLMQYICREWLLGNERIQSLVNNTRIHLLPTMNPDGYNIAAAQGPEKNGWLTGRFNYRGYDLNRQFPDLTKIMYDNEANFGPNNHLEIPTRYWREHRMSTFPEIHSVMRWMEHYDFILSAQLHGGELVANYPYDLRRRNKWHYIHNKLSSPYSKSPDDDVFIHLSSTYAENHRTMSDPLLNNCEDKFGRTGGITNGAAWYSVSGGMQDFNYLHSNCFEILIELSCRKFPPASHLPVEWSNNKEALLKYMEQVHIGIKGIVTDENGVPVKDAALHVDGVHHDVTTNSNGEYWRMLLPGKYTITARRDGKTDTKWIFVTNSGIVAARHDFIIRGISRSGASTETATASLQRNTHTMPPQQDDEVTTIAPQTSTTKHYRHRQQFETITATQKTRPKSIVVDAGSGYGLSDSTGGIVSQGNDDVKSSGFGPLTTSLQYRSIQEITSEKETMMGQNNADYVVSGDHSLDDQKTSKIISTIVEMAVTPALVSDSVTRSISKELFEDDEGDETILATRVERRVTP